MENMPLTILPCHRQDEPHHMGSLGCDANLGISQDEYLSKGDADCVHICGLGGFGLSKGTKNPQGKQMTKGEKLVSLS